MCQILDILHKYVPTVITKEKVTLPTGEEYSCDVDNLYEVLTGRLINLIIMYCTIK